jgi:outer membrane lipoprotein-sorting protein
VLGQYVGGCQTAQQVGEETVANRTAYKIRVTPDASACPEMAGVPAKDVIAKLGVLTVWVDKETFLPLRTEQATPDGGVSIYTVTQIEVGGDIGESTFAYEAPEGVAVQEVANLTEAKNVLSGYVPDSTPPTPPEPKD